MTVPLTAALPRIQGVHHTAFRCRDAEETRRFYEGVLGLPLAAALSFDRDPGTNMPVRFMHLFFEMGDGRYVAFFDLPASADESRFKRKNAFNLHIAFEVPRLEDLAVLQERLQSHGVECHGPVDHEFVKSIYTWDPNGIQVEITARTAGHAEIMVAERSAAAAAIAEWEAEKAALLAAKAQAPSPGQGGA